MTYDALSLDAIQKWPNIDPARMARAVEIAGRSGTIYNAKCPRGQFDVRNSEGTGWYRVNTKAKTCTCRDHQRGNICKHRLAVWLFVEARTRTAAQVRRVPQNQLMRELGYA